MPSSHTAASRPPREGSSDGSEASGDRRPPGRGSGRAGGHGQRRDRALARRQPPGRAAAGREPAADRGGAAGLPRPHRRARGRDRRPGSGRRGRRPRIRTRGLTASRSDPRN
ncbi:hypothetical protein CVT23_09430 [Minwuia thermotolerans]|uniref:Uncharacterized protein n=1 Tax=Minwuia thermotolerans TaxID=2056226 RepID=A0A2M9G2P9_9PROT|nr:hypothetical protein CVT23_09430 [Minwuia thermotolerans]